MFNIKKCITLMLMLLMVFFMSCSNKPKHPVTDKKCKPGQVWVYGHYSAAGHWIPGHCAKK